MDGTTTERIIGGRYRLESVLGRGGMGVVWAAHDALLGRPVAVKEVLPVAGLGPDELVTVRRRTIEEARNAARLPSGASVLVYDVVEWDGEPWIVMERLAPRTLDDVLHERGTLATHEAAELGLRVLSALDAAHAVGVLHRDVKPSNVMFRGEERMGNAVLTDFGVARFAGDPSATVTGTLIGSPAFVSPERASGAAASPASDLWALGVTLWIVTEGVSPFHRDGTLQTLSAVLTSDPPPLQLAGPLAPLLTGLLDKDPHHRLSAEQARHLLERIHGPRHESAEPTEPLALAPARRPEEALPPSPTASAAAPRSQGRGWLVAGALAVAAVGAAATAQLLGDRGPQDAAGATPRSTASAPATQRPADASASTTARPNAGNTSAAGSTSTGTVKRSTATSGASAAPATTAAPVRSADAGRSADTRRSGSTLATAAVPPGMRRYSDRTGFSIAVPSGWRSEHRGDRVYLRDPSSPAYLLVDQTTTPASDPVADWRQQERRVSQRLPGYRLVRIDPLQVKHWPGADWEFRHGTDTHVLNRNLVTGPKQAYALYWSVPDSAWSRRQGQFEQITRSFRPRG